MRLPPCAYTINYDDLNDALRVTRVALDNEHSMSSDGPEFAGSTWIFKAPREAPFKWAQKKAQSSQKIVNSKFSSWSQTWFKGPIVILQETL